jgi:hypothetical protein
VYRNQVNEAVALYGGKRVTGLTPVTDPGILAHQPEEGRGKVLQVHLSANGVTDISPLGPHGWGYKPRIHTEVFWNGEALPWVRWPNGGLRRGQTWCSVFAARCASARAIWRR